MKYVDFVYDQSLLSLVQKQEERHRCLMVISIESVWVHCCSDALVAGQNRLTMIDSRRNVALRDLEAQQLYYEEG